jgi:hypothetical protein
MFKTLIHSTYSRFLKELVVRYIKGSILGFVGVRTFRRIRSSFGAGDDGPCAVSTLINT